jgi:hypothetical protein
MQFRPMRALSHRTVTTQHSFSPDDWPTTTRAEFAADDRADGSFTVVTIEGGQLQGWEWHIVERDGKGNDVSDRVVSLDEAISACPPERAAVLLEAHQDVTRHLAVVVAHTTTSRFAPDDSAANIAVIAKLRELSQKQAAMLAELEDNLRRLWEDG